MVADPAATLADWIAGPVAYASLMAGADGTRRGDVTIDELSARLAGMFDELGILDGTDEPPRTVEECGRTGLSESL